MIHSRTFCVVAQETLDRFGVKNPDDFASILASKVGYWGDKPEFTSFEILREKIETYQRVMDVSDLSPKQRVWRDLANKAKRFLPADPDTGIGDNRDIRIGDSPADNAWTDGESFIAISKQFLDDLNFDMNGFTELGVLLLHEMSHQTGDADTMEHDHDFYERFHDLVRDHRRGNGRNGLGSFIEECLLRAPKMLAEQDLKVPRKLKSRHAKIAEPGDDGDLDE